MRKVLKIQCSDLTFILGVTLFITLAQNTRFFTQAWKIVGVDSLATLVFFISMPIVLFCLLNIIFSLLFWPYIRKPLAIAFILIGAGVNYFMYAFNVVIDRNMIQNALETNVHETLDLVSPQMVLWFTCLGIIPSIIVLLTKVTPSRGAIRFFLTKTASIVISALVVLIIAFFLFKDYAPFFRNNRGVEKTLVPSNAVAGLISNVSSYIDSQKPFVQIGLDAKKGPEAQQRKKKTLLVLVVGETARAENFSLGGYSRDTNPMLSKRDGVLFFQNVSSCGTATAVSVPCMFSDMNRKGYSGSRAKHTEGVLDILARAKVNVFWRENDGGCKGVCDRVPNEDMTLLKLPDLCKNRECKDDVLLYKLEDYINGQNDDGIIVMHQMGSHGPSYHDRYTSEYRKFTPTCDTNDIQNCDTKTLVNTYDNTIVYTDAMLDQVIAVLDKHRDKFATALIYLSDHGESLGENGLYLHGAPYAIAPSQQTHVPFILWTSPEYRESQNLDENCLQKEAKTGTFSQDNLFHSLLGIFDIQTNVYNPALDMFKTCRSAAK
ncbi:phosphoethanolamine transferase EptA [Leminorella grimontii]|uniref:phosphoethanolamine transferase EptA n=1 Tax=Leminorella grimontii TaxID=82981 RepID=UPI00321F7240